MRFVMFASAVIVALAACSDDSGPVGGGGNPPADEVWMQNSAFNPVTRNVSSGTSVTFRNRDAIVHNVVSSTIPAGAADFTSGNLGGGGTFDVDLTVAGTYQYFCSIHGSATTGMRGTIVVN